MSQTTLTWFGHSNMMLADGKACVLFDPFFEGNPQAPDWQGIPAPDIIAVTHDHGDHLGQTVEIAKKTGATVACIVELGQHLESLGLPASQIVSWNIDGTVEIKGVRLTMTQAFHSCEHGVPVGFVVEMPEGLVAYHAGDTGLFGDMQLIGDRFGLDIVMLPIGGYYTMDGAQAARACALLHPACAVPMHYATFDALASSPSAFTAALTHQAPACHALLPAVGKPLALPAALKNIKAV